MASPFSSMVPSVQCQRSLSTLVTMSAYLICTVFWGRNTSRSNGSWVHGAHIWAPSVDFSNISDCNRWRVSIFLVLECWTQCIFGLRVLCLMGVSASVLVLSTVHTPHQGIEKSISNPTDVLFWPGMRQDINHSCVSQMCSIRWTAPARTDVVSTSTRHVMQMVS